MPRYVLQEHRSGQNVHWDFMVEQGDHLATWRVELEPDCWAHRDVPCERIADHRLAYLDYQGPVTSDRGHVKIAAQGRCYLPTADAKLWEITFSEGNWKGSLRLTHLAETHWQLTRRLQQPQ